MSAFDWIELLTRLGLVVLFVICTPWQFLFKRSPKSLEPFAYFGSMPDRWLVAEYFFPTTEPGYPRAGHHLHYSDHEHEFVSAARVRL